MFFSLYFVMTGMHAIHMIIGVGLFAGLAVMGRGRDECDGRITTRPSRTQASTGISLTLCGFIFSLCCI